MKANLWTRNELILTINLYCKLPFGHLHSRNKHVQHLAKLIGRTPAAVALKLVNFASFDPSLKARSIKGMQNTSKLDQQIWKEFYHNWDDCAFESERLLAQYQHQPIEKTVPIPELEELKEGKEKMRLVQMRVNQHFFRSMILASYNNTCCITGINNRALLVASHIIPWSSDKANRLNPHNGLCLNALHDKAFDHYLFTVTPDYKIKLSKTLMKEIKNKAIADSFLAYHGKSILVPNKFLPAEQFLIRHNSVFNERNT